MTYLCVSLKGNLEIWSDGGLYGGWEVESDASNYVEYSHFGPENSGRVVIETWEE